MPLAPSYVYSVSGWSGSIKRTPSLYRTALNVVEKLWRPRRLVEVNAKALSRFQRRLRTAANEAAAAQDLENVQRKYRQTVDEMPWAEFVTEYQTQYVENELADSSQTEVMRVLKRFGKLMKPKYVASVDEVMIDQYVAKRRKQRGRKLGSKLAAATIKKDVRTLLAALSVAKRWKYVRIVPDKPKVKGVETDKRFVTEEHFDAMLTALDAEKCPVNWPVGIDHGGEWTARDYWLAFLVTAWITGMRRGALLALRWCDVNVETAEAISRGSDNKGRKDTIVKLGDAVPLLLKLKPETITDETKVFPWPHATTWMDHELLALQQAAGIDLPCTASDSHECTDKCHVYTLHGFRRAHATYNYGEVTDRELQRQMGHASFATTRSYAKYAEAHRQKPYNARMTKLAKAKAKGLKLADAEHVGGQVADKDNREVATA